MEAPRAVAADELPLLIELVDSVLYPHADPRPSVATLFPRVFREENLEHLVAVFFEGLPVAAVAYLLDEAAGDGWRYLAAGLSSVVTRADYRGRGLATMLLDDCLGRMRREGVRIMLSSLNRRIYGGFGGHPTGLAWFSGNLRRESLPPSSRAVLRLVDDDSAVPLLKKLHELEKPGFVRDEKDFGMMWRADAFARVLGMSSRTWLAMHDGEPMAYAVVTPGEPKKPVGRLVEYAGDRRTLVEALRPIMISLDIEVLEAMVAYTDQDMLARLRRAGDWRLEPPPGAAILLDPLGLWRDLEPHRLARLGATGAAKLLVSRHEEGPVNFVYGQEAVTIHDQERLLSLLFGEPSSARNLPANLCRALSACLPLPLPALQGLNYL